MYQMFPYYCAKLFAEAPLIIALPLFSATITYWMVGLQRVFTKYLTFIAAVSLGAYVGDGLGMVTSAWLPHNEMATGVMLIVMLLFIVYSGFYRNLSTGDSYLSWIAYISNARWVLEILLINEFKDLPLNCPTDGSACAFPDGQAMLNFLGIGNGKIWYCFVILLGMLVIFRVLAFIGLRVRKSEKKAF